MNINAILKSYLLHVSINLILETIIYYEIKEEKLIN